MFRSGEAWERATNEADPKPSIRSPPPPVALLAPEAGGGAAPPALVIAGRPSREKRAEPLGAAGTAAVDREAGAVARGPAGGGGGGGISLIETDRTRPSASWLLKASTALWAEEANLNSTWT